MTNEDPLGAEPDRERRGRVVGVHVQRALGERGDDRDPPAGEGVEHRLRRARQRRADAAELGHAGRLQPDLVAGEADRARPDRARRAAALTSSSASRTTSIALVVGHAAAADERDVEPGARHRRGDLRPAAVDDDDASSAQPSVSPPTAAIAPPTLTTITSCTPR